MMTRNGASAQLRPTPAVVRAARRTGSVLALLVLLAASLSCGGASEPGLDAESTGQSTKLPLRRIASTQRSCHGDLRSDSMLATAAEFADWWSEVACSGEPLPAADFTTSVVIAVRDEPGPNACHAVRIGEVRVLPSGGTLVVVNRHVPAPGQACSMMIVHSADAVAVPRLTLPVIFEWRRVVGPPDVAPH